tara:strand:- start:20589 stop:21017 length:429 start_codon:yes stop_codon:yes gene_type:complete
MKQIAVICFANYCRSPVAEKLLSKKFEKNLIFKSFGIQPKVDSMMDSRSQKFLKENGIDTHHFPRKVSNEILENSKCVLCMDHFVLTLLNKGFPKYMNKFKLFTFKSPGLNIEDPYRLSDEKYLIVMNKIISVCEKLEINDF